MLNPLIIYINRVISDVLLTYTVHQKRLLNVYNTVANWNNNMILINIFY